MSEQATEIVVPEGNRNGRPRVVVGVDGSDSSLAALRQAVEEARLRGAVLEVVNAWQLPFELAAGTYAVPTPAGEMQLWARQVVDDALSAADVSSNGAGGNGAGTNGDGRPVEVVERIVNGSAAQVLADAASGAELLVVGTRGHSRVTGLFLGSVSQYLAVHAPCPVLVVHAPHGAGQAPAPVDPPDRSGAAGPAQLTEIPEDECLSLLAGHSVGRLVVVHEGKPVAVPVNYVLDGRTVAVRTDPGTLLDWSALGHVAFEVDEIDEASHEGWSVLVQGIGRDVTDGVDAWSEHLRGRELQPWAGGERIHWIALSSPRFTGRRIVHRRPGSEGDPPVG